MAAGLLSDDVFDYALRVLGITSGYESTGLVRLYQFNI